MPVLGELSRQVSARRAHHSNPGFPGLLLQSSIPDSFDFVGPGCTTFRAPVNPFFGSWTVNNRDRFYYIEVDMTGNDGQLTRLRGVRIFYRLQVSPAPAVDTFGDVPVGHPQH